MNIVVCVKPVLDMSIIDPCDYVKGTTGEDDLVYIINPPDMAAVEEAVRIKQIDGTGTVTVVSLAPPSADRLLRRCLAVGADQAFRCWDDGFDRVDAYSTGVIIAKAIRLSDCDLILCGVRATDSAAGQVGYVIANILDIPIVTGVTDIQGSHENNKIMLERKLEKGNREMIEVVLPALFGVEEAIADVRYASLVSLFRSLRSEIKSYGLKELGISYEEAGLKQPKTKTINISVPKPRPKKIFTPDSNLSAAERMRLIMSGGIAEKEEDLFEGSPEDLSLKFVDFLRRFNILESDDIGSVT